ncbi:IS66 family transposase [Anaerocolumna jejuensis]|uniref:IS66 family transposase n=1 Tax=Anaerocolumna jejuensis TaxID=259063 RepID=UPI0038BCA3D7
MNGLNTWLPHSCPECKATEEPQFIKDNGKPALISGSYASKSLLAYIIYRKYGLYIPLYRQEQDFLQMNAPIGLPLWPTGLLQLARNIFGHYMTSSIGNF